MLTYVLATAGFKHDIVKQDHHCKLSLNYDKQFNKGGYSVAMSCKKGGTYEYFFKYIHTYRLLNHLHLHEAGFPRDKKFGHQVC